ncbi:SigE family RNA polymerase sigma factor [Nocardioides speluncae]|uniref:SigE family RNA polymerase sigma factor n=1 Tax=Nocardioides speluncae TaxID=2670337 RepID=UPI000D68B6A7|nr:SigE family RNA polymerase sigma factor [Nocardioides speluncae]
MGNIKSDAAFTEYVAARQRQYRRLAYTLCGDWHRSEDLVQVAFTKLYLAWPRIQRQGAEDSYLRRILVRTNIDESRRAWRRHERLGLPSLDRAEPTPPPEDAAPVIAALARLPEMQRKVVVLRFWLDLSVEQTADDLKIAPGTVKAHTHAGLHRLRDLLAEPTASDHKELA